MSAYYPLLLDLAGKTCVIVGGGAVAGRKAQSLLEAGARVVLVAPELAETARELYEAGQVEWRAEPYHAGHLAGAALVIAATDNQEVNHRARDDARTRGVFINVVDQPELCDFIVPSVLRRGDLIIAISTSGASPAVAKRLREGFEKEFGPQWAEFLTMMKEARERALAGGGGQKEREERFNRLADGPLLEMARRGDLAGVKRLIGEIIGT